MAALKKLPSCLARRLPPQGCGRLRPRPTQKQLSPLAPQRLGDGRGAITLRGQGQSLLKPPVLPTGAQLTQRVPQTPAHPSQLCGVARSSSEDTTSPCSTGIWGPFQLDQAKWTPLPRTSSFRLTLSLLARPCLKAGLQAPWPRDFETPPT